MTQEEKSLLLKDLSARLSYGTIVSVTDGTIKYNAYIESVSYKNIQVSPVSDSNFTAYTFYKINEIKSYLRPISSMTEEESAELSNIISEWFDKELFYLTEEPFLEYALSRINYSISPLLFDWLNAHHFDYRGLIDKGLALEAPEDMY